MPAQTVVTLIDEDGDEFPVALPGVFPTQGPGPDVAAALKIAEEAIRNGSFRPTGELRYDRIEYVS